ncbi:MAG: M23 family peptidase [Chitinophagaceae bacterium]|nr:M23 family peptidase [Chitinophagaceae bacterium]
MKKVKYYYNTNTLRYEKAVTPLRVKVLRVFGFVAASLVTASLIAYFAFQFIGSPREKMLELQNREMRDDYYELAEKARTLEEQMKELETRDNDIYRAIFEATPIPDSARAKKIETQKELEKIEKISSKKLASTVASTLDNLVERIRAQRNSYEEVSQLVKDKERLLAHTPAIQPVSNKNLKRIASGFGYRIDPIYKTPRMHPGLDFTAPQGTPIYATANGRVEVAGNSGDGYGKHVIINHGYGYQTLYGHMVRVKARVGQNVKRGEVIGWVGSTGKSTGPHCHYEVIKNGSKIDPIYFFYNDLTHVRPYTPESLEQLLKLHGLINVATFPGLRCKPISWYRGKYRFLKAFYLLPFRNDTAIPAPTFLRGHARSIFGLGIKPI